jgi:UDP-N-acetylglucosamine diphosphorylase/glucosamine-1-phosphate N-acetyltransferase
MNIILFDTSLWRNNLLPFTYTRPIAAIRCGILTIAEKWEKQLQSPVSYATENYLSEKFKCNYADNTIYILGSVFPTPELVDSLKQLKDNEAIASGNEIIAFRTSKHITDFNFLDFPISKNITVEKLENLWDIFSFNGNQIRQDFDLITKDRNSEKVNDLHTAVYNENQIFIEEGVKIRASVLNAEDGPIYIGKNAEIQEGSLIKGPFAMCEGSVINMGGKMRGDTTVGPFSKVGGEISNSVIFGYSNKAHDGFMGNSVLGEWCNLGADTNTSNLKNNYSNVKIWHMATDTQIDTNRQFCGLMMGDHSKTGINTMLNTGTVAGVAANIFGGGFPAKNIPCFSWGGANGFETYTISKAFETAKMVFGRRKKEFNQTEQDILTTVFEQTKNQRIF